MSERRLAKGGSRKEEKAIGARVPVHDAHAGLANRQSWMSKFQDAVNVHLDVEFAEVGRS